MTATPANLKGVSSSIRSLKKYKLLLAIILCGFLLRLFQLGNDILWYDEVGVFGVTKVKTLEEIVFIVRSHVMAMPLDYFITWLISRLGAGNAILRFPSVVWGTLTLPVCYLLVKDLLESRTALWVTFLAAISPFLIQYSQELRFYASLTFFYIASTLLLLRALKSGSTRQWLVFTLVAIIGVFFHMYVLLALANGVVWFLFMDEQPANRQKTFRSLIVSYTVILLAFAVGFLTFSGRVTFSNPFLENGISFAQTLLTGLGWLPFYSNAPEWSWGWGILCLLLEIWGMLLLVKKPASRAALLFFSTILQAVMIIALDVIKQYYFMPRQLLPFLPILLMVAGLALANLEQKLADRFVTLSKSANHGKVRSACALGMVLIVLLIDSPALATYYHGSKGNADTITAAIHAAWQPGNTVLVINPYEGGYYNYFFSEILKDDAIIPSVWQADWGTIADSKTWPGKVYVITPYLLTTDQQGILTAAGYRLMPLDYTFSRYNRLLYIKGD